MVEVCVGRQVDRVRGRERRQAGEQEQVINNRLEEAEDRDRDIRPYSAKAEQYGEFSVQVLKLLMLIMLMLKIMMVSASSRIRTPWLVRLWWWW